MSERRSRIAAALLAAVISVMIGVTAAVQYSAAVPKARELETDAAKEIAREFLRLNEENVTLELLGGLTGRMADVGLAVCEASGVDTDRVDLLCSLAEFYDGQIGECKRLRAALDEEFDRATFEELSAVLDRLREADRSEIQSIVSYCEETRDRLLLGDFLSAAEELLNLAPSYTQIGGLSALIKTAPNGFEAEEARQALIARLNFLTAKERRLVEILEATDVLVREFCSQDTDRCDRLENAIFAFETEYLEREDVFTALEKLKAVKKEIRSAREKVLEIEGVYTSVTELVEKYGSAAITESVKKKILEAAATAESLPKKDREAVEDKIGKLMSYL